MGEHLQSGLSQFELRVMKDDRAKRREAKWAARYERSRARFVLRAQQHDSILDWPVGATAVSTASGPNGETRRLRLVPPGDPVGERDYPFILRGYSGLFLRFPGLRAPQADNCQWVVLVQRQRGPFRGFDTVHSASFSTPADAAAYLQAMRRCIEAGDPLPPPAGSS